MEFLAFLHCHEKSMRPDPPETEFLPLCSFSAFLIPSRSQCSFRHIVGALVCHFGRCSCLFFFQFISIQTAEALSLIEMDTVCPLLDFPNPGGTDCQLSSWKKMEQLQPDLRRWKEPSQRVLRARESCLATGNRRGAKLYANL